MEINQDSLHNCDFCNDTGFLLYEKKYPDHEFAYTTATYCTCTEGQRLSDVHDVYFRENRDKVKGKGKKTHDDFNDF